MILKNMFDPADVVEDPFFREELERDITAECAKLGAIDKVRGAPITRPGQSMHALSVGLCRHIQGGNPVQIITTLP